MTRRFNSDSAIHFDPARLKYGDARWFGIDSDAKLNGISLGTVEIDPYAFGLSIGRRF